MKLARRTAFAFTLIELVVALVLGSLLLTLLMAVMRRSFTQLRVASDDTSLVKSTLLIDQLRRDFTNARRLRVGVNAFELTGFIHRDPETMIATQLPARAVYEVQPWGDSTMLVRVQSDLNPSLLNMKNQLVEPAYGGVNRLVVTSNAVEPFAGLNEPARVLPGVVGVEFYDSAGRMILKKSFARQVP